jgi:hypothetical protein
MLYQSNKKLSREIGIFLKFRLVLLPLSRGGCPGFCGTQGLELQALRVLESIRGRGAGKIVFQALQPVPPPSVGRYAPFR